MPTKETDQHGWEGYILGWLMLFFLSKLERLPFLSGSQRLPDRFGSFTRDGLDKLSVLMTLEMSFKK